MPEAHGWVHKARCAQEPTPGWWQQNAGRKQLADAQRMCRECPVWQHCGAEALAVDDQHAVRGGYRMWIPADRQELWKALPADLRVGAMPPNASARECSGCGETFIDTKDLTRCHACRYRHAAPVIAHVRCLREDHGLTYHELHIASGVAVSTIAALISPTHPAEHVSLAVSEALLAIPIPGQRVRPDVEVEVVRAHVRRLQAAELTNRGIAELAGLSIRTLNDIMYRPRVYVTAVIAAALMNVEVPGRAPVLREVGA